jgi:micrococcal nuclease
VVVASERERSSSESDQTNAQLCRARKALLGLLMSAFLLGCSPDSAGRGAPDASPKPVESAIVERVVDGDTVDVRIGALTERVRLLGVDAPESVARHVPVQCFGAEASAALTDLLPPGTVVNIERDVEARDRYGRLLLYLHRADDDLFVNGWLIESGLAEAVSYEPNVAYDAALGQARRRAARELVGLWAACDGPDQPLE